jgi:hypothetical protein
MKINLLTAILISFFSQADAQFCFSPITAYPAGGNSVAICTGYFNSDSILDLAVANRSGTVSVLMGNFGGLFNAASSFNVGYLPYSICSADFNNDNNADIATANRGPWDISTYNGNGMGTFVTGISIPMANPTAVITDDFNLDGKADLAFAHYGLVLIALGDGTGNFSTPHSTALSSLINCITSADYNNDSIPDIAACEGGTIDVVILQGDGLGGLTTVNTLPVDTAPIAIINGDFNNDGLIDLATANVKLNTHGSVSVFLNTGTGNFGPATNFSLGINTKPVSICTADFDGDNKPDLAFGTIANNSTPYVTLMQGDGFGGFGIPMNIAVDSFPTSIASADFDSDGKTDLALVCVYNNASIGNVDVLLNCTPTGISEMENDNHTLLVYPNPHEGIFSIQINTDVLIVGDLEILNITGEKMLSVPVSENKNSVLIDLSNRPKGVYLAKLKTADRIVTKLINLQ